MKWLKSLEELLIEIGKSPERKFLEEQKKQQEWEKMLSSDVNTLDEWMAKIEKKFESK